MSEDIIGRFLEAAPHGGCIFCGYAGSGYYQTGTHAPSCPWYMVGGWEERAKRLPAVLREQQAQFVKAADAIEARDREIARLRCELEAWRVWSGGRKPDDPTLVDYNQMLSELKRAEEERDKLRGELAEAQSACDVLTARVHERDAAIATSRREAKDWKAKHGEAERMTLAYVTHLQKAEAALAAEREAHAKTREELAILVTTINAIGGSR